MGAPTPADVSRGHAFYTRRSLAIYDPLILGFFSRTAWRCPARTILEHHSRNVTGNHLDVGVGTGYFVDKCAYPTPTPRIGLLDPNPACLERAAERLRRYDPEPHRADVLEPLALHGPAFDSISMNYVFHCLPGDIAGKAIAIDHLLPHLSPGGTFFGATLLHGGVTRNWYARQIMARNNRHGVFSNTHDDLDGLTRELDDRLDEVTVRVVGCVGLFAGTKPSSGDVG